MAGGFTRANEGDPWAPSAAFHNATLDAIAHVRMLRGSGGAARGGIASAGVVVVKNTSGIDRGRFDVLGIDTVYPTPAANLNTFKAGPFFHCITPDIADHKGRFVILLEPIAIDKYGAGIVSGVCRVQINVGADDEALTQADVKDGDAKTLESVEGGSAKILWKEGGIGVKWAVVSLGQAGPQQIHQGKLTANLLYDDETGVTVNIWTGTPLAETSPLRTVDNVLPPLVMSSGQLDSGDPVTITWIDGRWYATNAPC